MIRKLSFEQKTKLVGNEMISRKPSRVVTATNLKTTNSTKYPVTHNPVMPKHDNEKSVQLYKQAESESISQPELELLPKKYNLSSNFALDLFIIVVLAYIAFLSSWVYICFGVYMIAQFILRYDYRRILISALTCAILLPILAYTGRSSIAKSFAVFVLGFVVLGLIRFMIQRSESKKFVYNS